MGFRRGLANCAAAYCTIDGGSDVRLNKRGLPPVPQDRNGEGYRGALRGRQTATETLGNFSSVPTIRAADPARLPVDAHHVHQVERRPHARLAALLQGSRRLRAGRRFVVLRDGRDGAGQGIGPGDVQYIHYHGTSTELNDRIETRAVRLACGAHAGKLAGSSLKSMIGHPQGACGAAGIAATLLAMRDGVVPPTINVDEPDPNCDLDYVPDIGRKLHVEHAIGNCIAFGSKNSAMLLRRV